VAKSLLTAVFFQTNTIKGYRLDGIQPSQQGNKNIKNTKVKEEKGNAQVLITKALSNGSPGSPSFSAVT
jgi:hypothetical protein